MGRALLLADHPSDVLSFGILRRIDIENEPWGKWSKIWLNFEMFGEKKLNRFAIFVEKFVGFLVQYTITCISRNCTKHMEK